jgi:hypothetical protein
MDTINDFIILVMLVLLVMLGGVELLKFIYHTTSWAGVGLTTISIAGILTFVKNRRKTYKSD